MIWVRKGSVGREVVDVQTKLLRLGYELGRTGVDGIFGPETERAVRLFQKMRGQEVDGIVGPDTWREMVDASFELGDRQLYLKEPPHRGDDVRELQATLNNLGFNAGRVSGVLGEQTDSAVR
ncbi:MAG: peptidoglycan-binding protein, partial [Actinomycetota bacterium]